MPTINRVRVVNVVYDKGTKTFANEIYELNNQNTLFNLSNGGGKTVLLQLILQCVLPNCDLGYERKFEHFFAGSRRTSYIMVEWRLDSIKDDYVLTGICATKGTGDDDDIKYFTFVHQYNRENPYDIKNIPVVGQDRIILDYNDFRKLLDQVRDYRIKVFRKDERSKYQEYLASFNIFAEEWDTIRTINLTEGGIGKFFEKSKTSRKFIENIVVPYVESIIFKDKNDREDLPRIFDKYSENLIQIPYLRGNIDLYGSFLDVGKNILEQVKLYSDLERQLNDAVKDIVGYRDFTKGGYEYYNGVYEEISKKIAEAQGELNRLMCRKDSYYLFVDEQKLFQLRKVMDKLSDEIGMLKRNISEKEEVIRYYNGARLLYEKREYSSKLSQSEAKYESMTKSTSESRWDLNRCMYSLLKLYRSLIGDIDVKIAKNIEKINSNKEIIKSFEDERRAINKALDDKKEKLGEVKQSIKAFKQKTDKMVKKYGYKEITLDLPGTIQMALNELKALKERLDENRQKIQDAENEVNDSEIERERISKEINEEDKHLEDKKREINSYKADYDEVVKSLAKYEIRADNIFDGQSIAELTIRQKEYEQRLWDKQNEYLKYQQKAMLLSGDYYISDGDILKIYKLLKENKYEAITGSEYLYRLQDDELKKRYIAGCPLLPYGIILDKASIKRLENDDIFDDIELDSLVPIISRESIKEMRSLDYGKTMVISDGVYCINNKGMRYYVIEAEFDRLKANISLKTAELKNDIRLLNQSVDDIKSSLNEVNKFMQRYSKDYLDDLKSEREAIESRIAGLSNKLSGVKSRIVELKSAIESIRQQNGDIEKDITKYEKNIEELNEYRQENDLVEDAFKQEKECARFIEENQSKLEILEKKLQNLRDENNGIKVDIDGLNREKDNVLGKINGINLPKSFNKEYPSGKTIEELEGIRKGLEEKLRGILGDTSELQNNMDICKREIAKRDKELKKLNLDEARLAETKPVTDETISLLEGEVSDLKKQMDDVRQKKGKLEVEIGKLEQKIEMKRGEILTKYDMKPFTDFEAVDDRIIEEMDNLIADCKVNIKDLEEKSNEVSDKIQLFGRQNEKANDFLAANIDTIPSIDGYAAENNSINYDKVDDESLVRKYTDLNKRYNGIKDRLNEQRKSVENAYQQLDIKFANCSEDAINKFISSIGAGEDISERLYSYESVKEVFTTIFDSVEKLKKVYEHDLMEADKQKEQLVISCKQHAERVLDEINSIDSKSIIKFNGTNKNMVQIRLESGGDELNLERMRKYIDTSIEEIKKEHELTGGDRNRLYPKIKEKMSTVKLLSVITDMEKSIVRVFKPQNNPSLSRYENWEAVLSFSGGEKYTCFFAMYISLLSYIRSKRTYGDSSLVLLADNPFGTTSAEHLVDVIFALAQKCKAQLICFTGLKETGIYSKFNTIYSLVLRNTLGGKQRMRSELIRNEMESGHVSFEQQVSLFDYL